jgi:hypothetical protein
MMNTSTTPLGEYEYDALGCCVATTASRFNRRMVKSSRPTRSEATPSLREEEK